MQKMYVVCNHVVFLVKYVQTYIQIQWHSGFQRICNLPGVIAFLRSDCVPTAPVRLSSPLWSLFTCCCFFRQALGADLYRHNIDPSSFEHKPRKMLPPNQYTCENSFFLASNLAAAQFVCLQRRHACSGRYCYSAWPLDVNAAKSVESG